MDWAPRNDVASLRRLDEELKRSIKGPNSGAIRRVLLSRIRPTDLLDWMPSVYIGTKEEIIQLNRNGGQRKAASVFLDKVPSYNGWGLAFLDALNYTGMSDVARKLCPDYMPPPDDFDNSNSGLAQNARGEPPPPPYSQ